MLYHNEGNGTFRDVTATAGVQSRLWGCSTTFLDYDRFTIWGATARILHDLAELARGTGAPSR